MQDTHCFKCGEILIKRKGFKVLENKIEKGRCICGEEIEGIWE